MVHAPNPTKNHSANHPTRLPAVRCLMALLAMMLVVAGPSLGTDQGKESSLVSLAPDAGPDLDLESADVRYLEDLDLLVFRQTVAGTAGGTTPTARGQVDGAPVLGYVFPTSLAPSDVGFRGVAGTVALAVTSHPDFDDTPLWDEDGNRNYDDDGVVFHSHWVVLVPDERAPGGLAVASTGDAELQAVLPPTNPGMPMYMDSPGFSIVLRGDELQVLVPAHRVSGNTDFAFDAVTAFMQVSTQPGDPMLGVHRVYEVLSGDLSLPFSVSRPD